MAVEKPGPRGPDAVKGLAITERGPDADKGPDAIPPGPFEAVTYEPHWLRITVPDYPHVAHLLLWPDGKVTWK